MGDSHKLLYHSGLTIPDPDALRHTQSNLPDRPMHASLLLLTRNAVLELPLHANDRLPISTAIVLGRLFSYIIVRRPECFVALRGR